MGRAGADQWADTEDVRSVCSECVTVKQRTEGDTDFLGVSKRLSAQEMQEST